MALSENYRTETIGRSDCRPIVRLSADTIVRWDYRPNPSINQVVSCEGWMFFTSVKCLLFCEMIYDVFLMES